jgi:rare lipoprotein A
LRGRGDEPVVRNSASCRRLLGCYTNAASAQSFEERWTPVPKAYAEPNPQPQPNVEPQPISPSSLDTQAEPKPRRVGPPTPKRVFTGKASYYNYKHAKTASGDVFRPNAFTAAHSTVPFGTRVRVTDLQSNKSVEVTITDRGPIFRRRVLDLSFGAAKALGVGTRGIIKVRAEIIG